MKARYFPNKDFLHAELGVNPSFVWRSIVSAQEAIKAGTRRKIGNGVSTSVWGVQWLPDLDNGFMTTEMPAQLQYATVASFMETGSNRWDFEVTRDICNDRDFELIKRIPVPGEEKEDSWFWIKDEKGLFTVRSCYRWLTGEIESNNAWFWKRMWSLKIPGKVANFLWRVSQGCLPTVAALAVKHVDVSVICPWCHSGPETDGHVLFGCDFAKTVWQNSECKQWIQYAQGETAFEVLSRSFKVCTKDMCVLIGMICWSIWNRRNKWVWERVNGSVFGVVAAARNLLCDWREAQAAKTVGVGQGRSSVGSKWNKPSAGWFKINCDASGVVNGGVGIGCVIRDSQGQFVGARCQRIDGHWSVREAEAISLKEALSWVKGLGLKCCIFETDSKVLAMAFNGRGGESYFHTIVFDCNQLVKHFDRVLVEFVCRSANCVAHVLANAAHSMSDLGEWYATPPDFIHHVLESDFL